MLEKKIIEALVPQPSFSFCILFNDKQESVTISECMHGLLHYHKSLTFLQTILNACCALLEFGYIYSAVLLLKTVGRLLRCLMHHTEQEVCISFVGVALLLYIIAW